ncbi:MAG: hypothetical protein ABWY54_02865 [Glaciihabitans sp.]
MFGLTIEKIAVIAVIAVFVLGPDRLPMYARRLADVVRGMRDLLDTAKARVKDELGDDFDDIEWKKLDPRQYDPRRIVREALAESESPAHRAAGSDSPVDGAGWSGSPAAGVAASGPLARGAAGSPADSLVVSPAVSRAGSDSPADGATPGASTGSGLASSDRADAATASAELPRRRTVNSAGRSVD